MADLGFDSRAELANWIRANIQMDSATVGKATVKSVNIAPGTVAPSNIRLLQMKSYGAVQSVPNNVVTQYNGMGGASMFSNTLNMTNTGSQLTVPTTAFYIMTINAVWAANVAGSRRLSVFYNGVEYSPYSVTPAVTATGAASGCVAVADWFNAGDTLQIWTIQNSGGALNVNMDVAVVQLFTALT